MTKSQGAIRSVRSLVFFASSVMTTPSITHFLGRSNKPKEQAPRPHLVLKPSKKKFRLFRSKIKRSSKISVCDSTTSIDDDDDDCSSTYSEYDVSAPSSSVPNLLVEYKHRSLQEETLQEEDEDLVKTDQDSSKEDDDWNWDSQSESGCLETSNDDHLKRCSAPIPITAPPNKRRHHRAISLPQNLIKDLPKSLYHRQPTPSESWDNDFELSEDFKVPPKVEESQVYIRMDMFNIQDFRTQIEELKNLRSKKLTLASKVQSSLSLQKPGNCAARRNLKIFKNLEEMYKTEWEEANVIIDISDMAQDRESRLDGGKSVGRGVSQTPSERHMHVLRKIIDEKSRDDDDDDDDDIVDVAIDDDDNDAFIVGPLDDDDKENDTTNFVFPPRTSTPKNESSAEPSSSRGILETNTQSLMDSWNFHGLKRDHSGLVSSSQSSIAKKKRRENVRISVDEMPSLIDHLRILQSRLLGHVVQLADLTALRSESSFSPNIFQRKLY